MVQSVQKAVDATKGWRAFATSAALAVVGVVASLDWSQIVSAENATKIVAAAGVVGMIVRVVFGSTAVGNK